MFGATHFVAWTISSAAYTSVLPWRIAMLKACLVWATTHCLAVTRMQGHIVPIMSFVLDFGAVWCTGVADRCCWSAGQAPSPYALGWDGAAAACFCNYGRSGSQGGSKVGQNNCPLALLFSGLAFANACPLRQICVPMGLKHTTYSNSGMRLGRCAPHPYSTLLILPGLFVSNRAALVGVGGWSTAHHLDHMFHHAAVTD